MNKMALGSREQRVAHAGRSATEDARVVKINSGHKLVPDLRTTN
ncbi:MAG: hypothetical protein AB7P69_17030 [Candidatus Binatia bacterium]